MKAKILFDKILEKVDLDGEKKNFFYDKLQGVSHMEIPDEFDEILARFETLHSEKSAVANRNIADKVFEKRKKDIDKATSARLSELGFNSSEIESVLSLPFEERPYKIAQLTDEKAKSKYNITESERIKQEIEAARREKERADRLQQQMIENEKRLKAESEAERVKIRLQYFVSSIPKSNVIPADKANTLVMTELQNMLIRDNAKIIEVNGNLRVVSAEDETQDIFDERNMRVNIEDYVKKAIREVRLEAKETQQTNKISVQLPGAAQSNRVSTYLKNFSTNKSAINNFKY